MNNVEKVTIPGVCYCLFPFLVTLLWQDSCQGQSAHNMQLHGVPLPFLFKKKKQPQKTENVYGIMWFSGGFLAQYHPSQAAFLTVGSFPHGN